MKRKGIIIISASAVLLLMLTGLFWDKINPYSQSSLILNLTTSFTPEDHKPSPFGKYFRPGDIVRKTDLGYDVVMSSTWLKDYHGGDAHYMQVEPPAEDLNEDDTVNVHVITCNSTEFIAKINTRLSKELSGNLGGIRTSEGCLTVVFGSNLRINDGGNPPEHPRYGYIGARSLITELKSSSHFDTFSNIIQSRSDSTDDLYVVDEAFVMFGGKYDIKFTGDISGEARATLNDFFDGLLQLESEVDYNYDGRSLLIEIDPFVRRNFMTLSWKLVPLEL